ncbi:probable G-protein coupled receptor 88 [Suricata suricatta]|uniref:probable G-protein coupled receptor 88 n=1 Tax=Suricata suricatta TaxID=37032 RepID=UPI0011558825|nr:probable G-protein coupled receptor 88 [Suricata suricatta]
MTNSSSTSTSSTTGGSLLLLCEEEESWAGRRIPVSLLYSGLAIGGTLANGMVIYLVSSFRKLQTTSNAFIVNGCAADLSVCALWMPQEAVLGLLPTGSAEPPADWDGAGGSYRLLRGGLLGLGLTVSLLSHCLVALNRYLLITRAPATYQALYQRRHTAGMLALSWALALGLVAVPSSSHQWEFLNPVLPGENTAYFVIFITVTVIVTTIIILIILYSSKVECGLTRLQPKCRQPVFLSGDHQRECMSCSFVLLAEYSSLQL